MWRKSHLTNKQREVFPSPMPSLAHRTGPAPTASHLTLSSNGQHRLSIAWSRISATPFRSASPRIPAAPPALFLASRALR